MAWTLDESRGPGVTEGSARGCTNLNLQMQEERRSMSYKIKPAFVVSNPNGSVTLDFLGSPEGLSHLFGLLYVNEDVARTLLYERGGYQGSELDNALQVLKEVAEESSVSSPLMLRRVVDGASQDLLNTAAETLVEKIIETPCSKLGKLLNQLEATNVPEQAMVDGIRNHLKGLYPDADIEVAVLGGGSFTSPEFTDKLVLPGPEDMLAQLKKAMAALARSPCGG